jgi:hypothetical protein
MLAVPGPIAVTRPVVETVATLALSVLHAIERPVSVRPCESSSVGVACVVCTALIVDAASETVTVATGACVTVIVAFPAIPSLVAVMLAVPTETPVTTPCAETVATAVLLDVQTIDRPVRTPPPASNVAAVA